MVTNNRIAGKGQETAITVLGSFNFLKANNCQLFESNASMPPILLSEGANFNEVFGSGNPRTMVLDLGIGNTIRGK